LVVEKLLGGVALCGGAEEADLSQEGGGDGQPDGVAYGLVEPVVGPCMGVLFVLWQTGWIDRVVFRE
jgi:hypothetical protein